MVKWQSINPKSLMIEKICIEVTFKVPYQETPYSGGRNESTLAAEPDEHIIKCSYCGRNLIVKDNINNGVAFLSHLKNDHEIFFTPQRMTEARLKKRADSGQSLAPE